MEERVVGGSGKGADMDAKGAAGAGRSAERPLGDLAQQQLDAWLEADSRHLGAYARAPALWLDMDRVAALDGGTRRDYPAPVRQRPWRRYAMADRKSVGQGQSVSVRVALGARRLIHKKKQHAASAKKSATPGEIR